MSIRRRILALYPSVIKRFRRWGLPGGLMLTYLTAGGLTINSFPYRLSTFGLIVWHRFAGFVTIVIMMVLLYDWVQQRLSSHIDQSGRTTGDEAKPFRSDEQRFDPYRWVNGGFYGLWCVVAALGVVLYGSTQAYWSGLGVGDITLRWIHATVGWLLLSLLTMKYYLLLSRWIRQMMLYLRSS
jgi:hypothetical protein